MPRICDVMRSEIARPAASSLALLMRMPEDRRCSEVLRADCEVDRLRCEFRDEMLVLITAAMMILQTGTTLRYVLVTLACPAVPGQSSRCCLG